MAKKPKTLDAFRELWMADLAPHVPEPIQTIALFNPPGVEDVRAAAIVGRTFGGLAGGLLANHAAKAAGVDAKAAELPAMVAAALTETALYLFEVDDDDNGNPGLHVLGLYDTWERAGLRVDMTRKLMRERVTFTLADGRQVEFDGVVVSRKGFRSYQEIVDILGA